MSEVIEELKFRYNKAGKRISRSKFKYNSCTRKSRWESLEIARKKRAWIWYETGKTQNIYHCQFCDGFHLTTWEIIKELFIRPFKALKQEWDRVRYQPSLANAKEPVSCKEYGDRIRLYSQLSTTKPPSFIITDLE